MLDILVIEADVYHLERHVKRLPVYRYLREVWQKEPPSEGLTVLALQQMVDYVEYVDDLTVLGEPWEAENEYDLYQDFLLDVIRGGCKSIARKSGFCGRFAIKSMRGRHSTISLAEKSRRRMWNSGRKRFLRKQKSAIRTVCCLNLSPTRRSLIMSGFTA